MLGLRNSILVLAAFAFAVSTAGAASFSQAGHKVIYISNDGRKTLVNPQTPIDHVLEVADVVFLVGSDDSLRVTSRRAIEASLPKTKVASFRSAVSTGAACATLAGIADAVCFLLSKGSYIPGVLTGAAFVIPSAITYGLLAGPSGEVFHEVEGVNISPSSKRTNYRKFQMAHYIEGDDGRPDLRLTFVDNRGDIDQVTLSQLVTSKGPQSLEFNFANLNQFFDFQSGTSETKYIYDGCESHLRPTTATAVLIGN